MTYHVLPESEIFSEHRGGAISRWVGNVLRHDANGAIVAAQQDESWQFERGRVRSLARLRWYSKMLEVFSNRVPGTVRGQLLLLVFSGAFEAAGSADTIYVHNRPEFIAAIVQAYPNRKFRLVLHMHNSHLKNHPRQVVEAVDSVAFCSEFLRQEAEQRFGFLPHGAVIPNGADEKCFFPSRVVPVYELPVVLFVGRLVPDKGVHVLVDAIRILEARGVLTRAYIVGTAAFGSNKKTSYVRDLQRSASANVHFRPYVTGERLADEYRNATVFCCPSVFNEPFGLVNVEAMACRVPVVASAVGGIPEVFRDGGALLVPAQSPDRLADALERLLSDENLRSQLAEQGLRSFRENFRWEVGAARYRELVANLHAPDEQTRKLQIQ